MYRLVKQLWRCEWLYLCALVIQVRNPSFGFMRELKKHLWFFLLFQVGIAILFTAQLLELHEFEDLLLRLWIANPNSPRSMTQIVARKEEIISFLIFLYPVVLMSALFYRKTLKLCSSEIFEELRSSPTNPLDYIAFNNLVFSVYLVLQVIIGIAGSFYVMPHLLYESFYIVYFGRMLIAVVLLCIIIFPYLLILSGIKKSHFLRYLLLFGLPIYILLSIARSYAPFGLFSESISQYLLLNSIPFNFFYQQVFFAILIFIHIVLLFKLKDSFVFHDE